MSLIVPDSNRSKAAFQGQLLCPYCRRNSWRFVESVNPTCYRYRCNGCKKTVRYDFSNNMSHAYSTFGKSKWRRLVEAFHRKKQGQAPAGL